VTTPEPMTATEARCEFRLVCGAGRDADRFLGRAVLGVVPARGEVVNLDGEPYVVYERGFALATASGSAIKIGVTGDLAKRLITLRAGHHEPLDVVAVLPADWTTERTVHGYFQASRVRGEWFRPTGDILEFIRLLNESRAPAE